MRRSGEVVGGWNDCRAPRARGEIVDFFCRTCQNGISGVPYCQNGIRFLGIDGMSMENAMSKKLNGRGGRFVLLAAALLFAWGLRADTATVDGYTYTYIHTRTASPTERRQSGPAMPGRRPFHRSRRGMWRYRPRSEDSQSWALASMRSRTVTTWRA